MVDSAQKTAPLTGSDNLDGDDDPFMALTRFAEGSGRSQNRFGGQPAGETPVPAIEYPDEAVATAVFDAPAMDDDLESALMAELGMGSDAEIAEEAAAPTFYAEEKAVYEDADYAGDVDLPAMNYDEPPFAAQEEALVVDDAPPMSLEDELAALLGEAPAAPIMAPVAPAPSIEPEAEFAAEEFDAPEYEPVQDVAPEMVYTESEIIEDSVDLDDTVYAETVAYQEEPVFAPAEPEVEAVAPVEAAPEMVLEDFGQTDIDQPEFDQDDFDLGDLDAAFEAEFNSAQSAEILPEIAVPDHAPLQEAAVDPLDELEAIISDDFSTALEDEPVVSASVTEAAPAQADAIEASLESEFDDFFDNASMDDFGAGEVASAATAMSAAAPALDTVETAMHLEDVPSFDVPELPEHEDSYAQPAARDDDFELDFDGMVSAAAATAAVGAGAAIAGSQTQSRAAAQAELVDELDFSDVFDEKSFEADLARDMEFVAHDLNQPGDAGFDEFDDNDDVVADAAVSQRRSLKVAGIVGGIALLGAVGLFFFSGGDTVETSGPVTVTADAEPMKSKPEEPGGQAVPNQDRAVFAESGTNAQPTQETLVTTSEEPVDLTSLPSEDLPDALASDTGKVEDRLEPQAEGEVAANGIASEGAAVTPRRVKTLVVRPDGTLEERTVEPVVAAEAVGGVPALADPAATETAAAEKNSGDVTFTPPAGETAAAPAPAPVKVAKQQPAVPVRQVQTKTVTATPVIADRPADQPVNIVNPEATNTQTAAAAPAPQPAAPVSNTVADGSYVVQIASLPSKEAAQASSANMLSKYRDLLSGRGLVIREATIQGKGTFYRVQVGSNGRDDANALCSRLKAAGGSCFVTR